jgi:uncharacterized protein YjaZ
MTEHDINKYESISVVKFEDESTEEAFLAEINKSYLELQKLLPTLPKTLNVIFGTNYDYGKDGVTGSAISADSIKVGINNRATDSTKQHAKIHSLIFHEGYHVAQGFHLGYQFSALDSAIYEGCATLFERDYAGSNPKWADYSEEDESTLRRWFEEIQNISAEQYFEPSGKTWQKWAFYDSETGESWRIYKVGTWLVEKILKDNRLSILDLNSKTAEEILSYLR